MAKQQKTKPQSKPQSKPKNQECEKRINESQKGYSIPKPKSELSNKPNKK